MKKTTEAVIAAKPRKALNTIFVTGADGKIYEIPAAKAAEFVITPERMKELCHLPILPYTKVATRATRKKKKELAEVGGRHKTMLMDGTFEWSRDWVYGAYRWVCDGNYYTGRHAHPWGDIDAVDMDNY